MKKLMTLLSAAAVAFGLQAADTGTSFEDLPAGDLDINSTTGELSGGPGYWVTNGNAQVSLTVTAGTSLDRNDPMTIAQYKAADQERYLRINSPFGNPVTRKIKTGDSSTQLIGDDGFYFDSLVKFTAFDEDPMTTVITNDLNGAKIAVWAKEVYSASNPEIVTATNLYVRAGFLGSNDKKADTYDCGKLMNPGDWQRLTIKAIKNIYKPSLGAAPVPAFVVFINGESVGTGITFDEDTGIDDKGIAEAKLNDKYSKFTTNGAIFPSLAQTGDDSDRSLSSVSFDGQGDVDDIVFTERVPDFAKDSQYAYIDWDSEDVVGLTIGETTLTYDEVTNGNYKISFANSEKTVTITPTYAEGNLPGTWEGTATIDGTSVTFTSGQTCSIKAVAAAASFNGTSYASLAAAITAAKGAAEADKTLKIFGATTASDNIDLTGAGVRIKIDLNGRAIGGISSSVGVWVVDSDVGGTVSGEVFVGDGSQIDAGTFEAFVMLGTESVITGGRFNKDENDINSLPAAPGYEFVEGTGDDAGYLVLREKSGGEPTIVPGETSIDNVPAESEADAKSKVVVESPDSEVVSDADYKEYFTLTAQETATGVYTVSIALNEEAIELPETLEDVGGDLQDAATAFGEDENASFTGIAAKPGLWYWIETATDPAFTENVTQGTAEFATGDTVDLEAVKPANADNAVFFRVCVDTTAKVQ